MPQTEINVQTPQGIAPDASAPEAPNNVWSRGENIAFRDGRTIKALGHKSILGDPIVPPYWMIPQITSDLVTWIYAGLNKIFKTDGINHTDITRVSGDYNASELTTWNGGNLGGILIANNGIDIPQSFDKTGNPFQDLDNWPSGLRAKVVRPYKEFLVALNLSNLDTGQEFPYNVRWSQPAEANSVPDSWDIADPTKDTGEVPLMQTSGVIVDMLPLRTTNLIYKEDSVWSMQLTGGPEIFRFDELFNDFGMLAANCVTQFKGQHFVVGQGDIYIHNGVTKESVADKRVRRFMFDQLDSEFFERMHVVNVPFKNEIWVNFVTATSDNQTFVSKALIWNYQDNTWAIKDLPQIAYMTTGILDPEQAVQGTWDTIPEPTWQDLTGVWNEREFNPTRQAIVMCSPVNKKLYQIDENRLRDGETFLSSVENLSKDFGTTEKDKFVSEIHPIVTGQGTLMVSVGTQNTLADGILWSNPVPFVIGVDQKVDFRQIGRYISVKFESSDTTNWALSSYRIIGSVIDGR